MIKADSHLESLLQRDRRVVLMLLFCVILVSWGYLISGGVMNLYWIAGLAIYVALEKSITAGHWLDYGLGATLTIAGLWLLIT